MIAQPSEVSDNLNKFSYDLIINNTVAGDTLICDNGTCSLSVPTLDGRTTVKLPDHGYWHIQIGDWACDDVTITANNINARFNLNYVKNVKEEV